MVENMKKLFELNSFIWKVLAFFNILRNILPTCKFKEKYILMLLIL